jgi:hypothetical protein
MEVEQVKKEFMFTLIAEQSIVDKNSVNFSALKRVIEDLLSGFTSKELKNV